MRGFNVSEIVTPAAKIVSAKGSKSKRAELATDLNRRFFHQISDTFRRNGEVSKDEIQGFLGELCPGLKLEVKTCPVGEKPGQGFSWSEHKIDGMYRIMGMFLQLPFVGEKQTIAKDKIEIICHESRHLLDFVTDSVRSVDETSWSFSDNRNEKYDAFYKSKLYKMEFPPDEAAKRYDMTDDERKAINKKIW